MYRKRIKGSKKYNAMRAARLKQIEEGPAPDYPNILPDLRRRLIVEDFDFGEIHHEINLFQTNRVDCYRMEVDGQTISNRIGWAKILEKIRKGFPRVRAQ